MYGELGDLGEAELMVEAWRGRGLNESLLKLEIAYGRYVAGIGEGGAGGIGLGDLDVIGLGGGPGVVDLDGGCAGLRVGRLRRAGEGQGE